MTATQKQIDYINTLLETRISNAQARAEKPQFSGVYWQQMEEIGLRLVSAIVVPNDLTKDQASKLIDALKGGKFSVNSIENAAMQWGRAYRGDIEWPARLENIIQAGTALYGAAWGEIAQQYMDILLNSPEPDQRSAAIDAWLHPAETPAQIDGFWFSTDEAIAGEPQFTSDIDGEYAAYRDSFGAEATDSYEEFCDRWSWVDAGDIQDAGSREFANWKIDVKFAYDPDIRAFLAAQIAARETMEGEDV